jgi:hypothetical protein
MKQLDAENNSEMPKWQFDYPYPSFVFRFITAANICIAINLPAPKRYVFHGFASFVAMEETPPCSHGHDSFHPHPYQPIIIPNFSNLYNG